jgi:hypothetical protein
MPANGSSDSAGVTRPAVAEHQRPAAAFGHSMQGKERIRSSLHVGLAPAATSHEIPGSTMDERAHVIQTSLYGAVAAARGRASGEALTAFAALPQEVLRWRPAP